MYKWKKYIKFNSKYSKEEFEKKKSEILENYENIENAKKEFEKLKKKTILKFANQSKCHNVVGNYLHNCHDGVALYDTYDAKNCSYMKDTEGPNSDSWDCNNYYYKCEFNYNIMGALQISKSKNSAGIVFSGIATGALKFVSAIFITRDTKLPKPLAKFANATPEYEKMRMTELESMTLGFT